MIFSSGLGIDGILIRGRVGGCVDDAEQHALIFCRCQFLRVKGVHRHRCKAGSHDPHQVDRRPGIEVARRHDRRPHASDRTGDSASRSDPRSSSCALRNSLAAIVGDSVNATTPDIATAPAR